MLDELQAEADAKLCNHAAELALSEKLYEAERIYLYSIRLQLTADRFYGFRYNYNQFCYAISTHIAEARG